MKVVKLICSVLSFVLMAALIIIAATFFVPKFMGGQSLAVLSGSMEPGIPVGSIVVALPTEAEELKTGDIITYRLSADTLVTHRVVSNDTQAQSLITKGDANDVEDGAPVAYSQVLGKVSVHLPLIGYISIYIKTPLGIAGICGVAFVMILLIYIPELLEEGKKEKEKKDE